MKKPPPNRPRPRELTARGVLRASGGAAAAARRGHPWIYREQLSGALDLHEAGERVRVVDEEGRSVGSGIVDPRSPLAVRLWTHGDAPFDDATIVARLESAISLRARLVDHDTTAYRWVHGEGDRAPGIVVDRYGDVAVLRLDGEAAGALGERIADPLFELARARGVRTLVLRSTERGVANLAGTKNTLLRGDPAPATITVTEHGVPFVVDLAHGQKTGAFLDQRENRRRVSTLSRGRRVLNLFSYAGGFSLHAVLGGATHCTSVDVAAGAHATAQASFRAAGVDPDVHTFVTADVFRFLERAGERKETWDLVISDPPNMAPSEATRARAIVSYRKLHGACAAVLAKGGVLCAASCSSHVSLEDFLGTLTDDALARDDLRIVEIAGAASDHPMLAAFPEGRYLEFCVLA